MTFLLLQIKQAMEIAAGSNAHQYATRANKLHLFEYKNANYCLKIDRFFGCK